MYMVDWWSLLSRHSPLQTVCVQRLFAQHKCPHTPCLSLWAFPILKFVISDQLRANTTIIDVTSQPCNQSQIILRMQRGKQYRPSNRLFLIDQSTALTRQDPADTYIPCSPTLTLASHQLCCYRDRQWRERRESETDSRRLL